MGYYSDLHAEGPYRTCGEADEARRFYPDEYRMAIQAYRLADLPPAALDAPSLQACIHCGDIQERASCDACMEWNDEPPGVPGEDTDPSAPPDLDPAPGRHLLFATKTTARAWLEEDWRRDAQARAWSQGLHDAAERNKG